MVKHLPTMQETRVQSLGWEDLLEKEVATHLHILRFLILLTILIPTCDSSSLAFSMMYSAYELNKQGDNLTLMYSFPNLEPVCCSMSSSKCCFLTCIQISKEAGQVV